MPRFRGPGPQPDWRPTPPLVVAGTTPVVDDDNDGWWTNSQYGFTNIPIAGAVAALSIAVATLGGFEHQDEVEAKIVGESRLQQVVAIGDEYRPFVFQDDEPILPTAIASVDGGEWIAPTWIVPEAWINDPNWDNDVPVNAVVEDSYEWDAQWIQAPPLVASPWVDDQFAPQPTVIDDEYGYVPYVEPVTIQLVNWPEAGIGDGTSVPLQIVESDWQVVMPSLPLPVLWSVWQTDEIASPPAPFIPEEDYWYQVRPDPVELVVVEWPSQGASAGGTIPTPISVEEENWTVWTPPLVQANRLYLPDPEEVPAGSLAAQAYGAQSFTAVNWRAVANTGIVYWWQAEDLPIPPIPLNIEEENWQVKTPPLVAAQLLFLPDPEQVPSGLVAPPIIEEEDWRVWTPPLGIALPLYLPDPEEVSAGSLIPPIVEIGIPAPIGHPVYIKGQRKKPRIYETANEQLKKILESITIEVVPPGSKSTDAPVLVKAISGEPVRPAPSAEAPAGFMPVAGEPPAPPDPEEEEIIALMAKWLV